MINVKQAGFVTFAIALAIGVWFIGHRLGMPPEYTTPIVLASLGAAVGSMQSFRIQKDGTP